MKHQVIVLESVLILQLRASRCNYLDEWNHFNTVALITNETDAARKQAQAVRKKNEETRV